MKILVSALEASSSAHLRRLMEEFGAGEVELCGIFDRDLSPWGAPLYSPSDFSVMGFVDVLKKLAFILKAQNQMVELAARFFFIPSPTCQKNQSQIPAKGDYLLYFASSVGVEAMAHKGIGEVL